ncbi:hypothetical protein C8R46DRAFT_1048487 [Mycena filopes]|nr:hypothetical protein C8R46DRAFT_1048487 [Mycena filopes]
MSLQAPARPQPPPSTVAMLKLRVYGRLSPYLLRLADRLFRPPQGFIDIAIHLANRQFNTMPPLNFRSAGYHSGAHLADASLTTWLPGNYYRTGGSMLVVSVLCAVHLHPPPVWTSRCSSRMFTVEYSELRSAALWEVSGSYLLHARQRLSGGSWGTFAPSTAESVGVRTGSPPTESSDNWIRTIRRGGGAELGETLCGVEGGEMSLKSPRGKAAPLSLGPGLRQAQACSPNARQVVEIS